MEVGQGCTDEISYLPWWSSLSLALNKFKAKVVGLAKKVKKVGKDDPRRVVHSFKVGFALSLVSLFYYISALFAGFRTSAIWAVLTVVVVMEYTVGGTLSKGLNRTFATLLAAALGVGAHQIAILAGEKGEPFLLGLFVFLLAAAATFSRFIPEIKARYDYGVTIFILTFSLVAVSSNRTVDAFELLQLAHQRISTIVIGVAICLLTSVFICPVWAGEDLHKLVAANLEKLASFLEGLGEVYFGDKVGGERMESKCFPQAYKSVLNSKSNEESLANLARWEPGHGHFGFRHPWKQYLKVGALSRQCAYSMEALMSYITTNERTQTPADLELRKMISSTCKEMSIECGKALKELAASIGTMTTPGVCRHNIAIAAATTTLKASLSEEGIPSMILETAITASLLSQVVQCVPQIVASVEELARLAQFRDCETLHKATVKPLTEGGSPGVVITVME
ncbi:aluminum-activated malate transporter 1-like [Phoenix dactylifera]|uniref:Aluminum-activated malate transporter 1-like n=1 Tax=Phoenix dactylifera TaxID=42345 RepID=A0A8B7BUZ5_PHODC|nr:aluminum-activated malate transporter 1-like [Phoenix dactylifera]